MTADRRRNSTCPQCGAPDDASGNACADRFAELLALDHSRTEPWGSRHGLAFSAYVLQHPRDYAQDVHAACWRMLYRVYVQGEDRQAVATEMRALHGGALAHVAVPAFPGVDAKPRSFGTTIADLGAFDAAAYPTLLDAWCRATLAGYGA